LHVDTRCPGAVTPSERAVLEAEVAHLRMRRSLPAKRSRRIVTVYREAVRGRYAEFGNGWRSALIHTIRKTPTKEDNRDNDHCDPAPVTLHGRPKLCHCASLTLR
jgi:hypothetical protein